MSFFVKWLLNIFVLVVVGILLYSFFPSIWYVIWGLASGIYRPMFITALVIVCGLPALRRE